MNVNKESNNENKLYFSSNIVLATLFAKQDEILESGLSFDGEAKIDNNISIITDKDVRIAAGLPETHKTYLKVMEMRDLTEDEMKYASKGREFLSKMFEIMFYNKKLIVACTLFVSTTLGMDIASGNFLGIVLKSVALLLINRPVKFIREILKMLQRDAKIEELTEYLREQYVLGLVDSVDDKNDIKMYVKLK